jgi:L-ascorbate metabolism protein UlaG (beta-lactamase superfamily)
MNPVYNKKLPILKSGWEGNPLDKNGKYVNLDGPSYRGFRSMLQWQASKNPYAEIKKNQASNVIVHKDSSFIQDNHPGFTWIGHATFLFQIGPYKLITDPVLGDIWPLKRFTDFPCDINDFTNLDYILLSHNHRDHCDKKSLKNLCALNPEAIILSGLDIAPLLKGWGIKNNIQEAGWYQHYLTKEDLIIHFLPAKHWNRRYLHDLNTMLWGSFMINFGGLHIYFGADSGMGSHYQEIKKLYPKIDYAFLGIGAYEPVWFMKGSHTSPIDVVKLKHEMKIGKVVPMHYGTFDLSNEPIFNPKNILSKLVKEKTDWLFMDIGLKHRI